MCAKKKEILSGVKASQSKSIPAQDKYSSDKLKIVWCFDMLDVDGDFAFNTSRSDFQHKEILDKMISYSTMTWAELRAQTHDKGKSKHHFLDPAALSPAAKERIAAKHFEESSDTIFSFALQNKLRIIGLREGEKFHAVWYDPQHKFCPSTKK